MYIFGTVAVVGVGGWAFVRTRFGVRAKDRILLRVPVVNGVMMRSNLFSLTSTFGSLLEAGIPTVEALKLSSDGLTNVRLREQLHRVTQEAESGTRLGTAFREQWLRARAERRERIREQDSGPSYYVLRRHRVGRALIDLVRRMVAGGALTTSKAGKVLGVKPRNVQALINAGQPNGVG